MTDARPGLNPRRLFRLMRDAIARCRLDLSGLTVLTEAATGPYVVTPVLAALAGAGRVVALARASRFGTVDEIEAQTRGLARMAGVDRAIEIVSEKSGRLFAEADIVANSGHVRPIDAAAVGAMRPGAVVALMYEAWELRPADLDLDACRRRGIRVAGVNERHEAINVFSDLGPLAVLQLADAGVAALHARILLLCDNPFGPSLAQGLAAAGARVDVASGPHEAMADVDYDAAVVALTPRPGPRLDASDLAAMAERWPGMVVVQFFGDIERGGVPGYSEPPLWPPVPPRPGHMGILPSRLGPEPIVRLQAGGLKAAEVVWRGDETGRDFVQHIDP